VLERIHAFLADNGPTGAGEIAARFLRLTGSAGPVADRLVAGMLDPSPHFERHPDGRWAARASVSPVLDEARITCVVLAPAPPEVPARGAALRIDGGAHDATWEARGAPSLTVEDATELLRLAGDGVLVAEHAPTLWRWLAALPDRDGVENPGLSLGRLARTLFPDDPPRTLADLAARMTLPWVEADDPAVRVRALADLTLAVLEAARDRGARTVAELLDLQYAGEPPVDFSRFAFDAAYVRALPTVPGCYVMRDREEKVLYVGKARNLRHRLASYFYPAAALDARVKGLLDDLFLLEVTELGSELEALVTEQRLIAELAPRVNTQRRVAPMPDHVPPRVVVLPGAEAGSAMVYGVAARTLVERAVGPEGADPEGLRELVATLLAAPERAAGPQVDPPPEAGLVARYLQEHASDLTWLDLRQVVEPGEGATRLAALIDSLEPEAPGRVV